MKLSQLPTLNIGRDYAIVGLGSILYIRDEETNIPILVQSVAVCDLHEKKTFSAFIVIPEAPLLKSGTIPVFKIAI